MVDETVSAFRKRVNQDPSLQSAFAQAISAGPSAVASFAQKHGYDISPEQVSDAIEQLSHGDELSDFELELVAGGGNQPTNSRESTGSAKSM